MNRLFTALALIFTIPFARAGDAVFSQDGGKIYLLDRQERPGQLFAIDVASGEMRQAGVPDAGGEPVVSVDRSNAGFILCLTPTALLAWDVKKGSTARVCRAPQGGVFVEHAYDPKTGLIAFVVRFEKPAGEGGGMDWQLWIMPKGDGELHETYVRRVESISGMTFDHHGNFFFGSGGDLWCGKIAPSDRKGQALFGCRFAPLATSETDNATPSQIGVRSVVAQGDWLYAHLERMGGGGWGNVIRLSKPKINETPEGEPVIPYDLAGRLSVYRQALASVSSLGENGSLAFLAASPDGRLVYFQAAPEGSALAHWLVRDQGKPEPFAVKAP